MSFRIAKSLDTLRSQVNRHAPNRGKKADGWVGDAAHRSRTSDHNPWVRLGNTGIVTALDVTHDPRGGFDSYAFAEHLRLRRDPRCKYVISNGRIFSSTSSPWTWRRYTGSNPHSSHVHVSVKSTAAHYDGAHNWDISYSGGSTAAPPAPAARPNLRKGSTGDHVRTVQRLLTVSVDGQFGNGTDAAVRSFQRSRTLSPDGIVGPLTWAELDELQQIPISSDLHVQARAEILINDPGEEVYAVALATPLTPVDESPPIEITNPATGRRCICQVIDTPVPEGVGLMLSPAAAADIGLDDAGAVNWAIADELDEGDDE